ncbi:MAG: hypothetical protein V7604_2879 [Hyphomicrobiales bacterium]|jgi:hypothetical protein
MTYSAAARYDVTIRNKQPQTRKSVPQNLLGGIALAGVALACGWILYANLAASRGEGDFAPTHTEVVTRTKASKIPAEPALPPTSVVDVALLYSTQPVGFAPKTFAQSVPLKSTLQFAAPTTLRAEIPLPQNTAPLSAPDSRLIQTAVLPKPRPPELESARTASLALQAMAQRDKALASAATDTSIFQKFFGKRPDAAPALAYAATDGGVFNNGQSITSGRSLASDGQTAIYDISARTVYMPDGTKLEAHSGFGDLLDDPRHVQVKMRGATPPHVYELTMREQLFHGVQALRLTPVGGEGEIYGRTGLLAHTYMLGPNGDSNGCVSFKNYDAFLKAYVNNKVKRLVVVARMS